MGKKILLLCFSILASAIFFINLLVIILYAKARRFRQLSNRLVVSSALCCILISIVFIPVNVIEESGYGKSVPWESAIRGHLTAFETMLMLLHTAALSYDRYISIVYGIRYNQIVTNSKLKRVLILSWLCPLLIALLPLIWSLTVEDGQTVILLFNIYQGLISGIILLALLIIIVLYMRMYFQQNRHWEKDIYLSSLKRRFKSDRRSRVDWNDFNGSEETSPKKLPRCNPSENIDKNITSVAENPTRVFSSNDTHQLCDSKLADINKRCHCSVGELSDQDKVSFVENSEENMYLSALILHKCRDRQISRLCTLDQAQRKDIALVNMNSTEEFDNWSINYQTSCGFSVMASKIRSIRLFIVILLIIVLCWTPIIFINFAEAARRGHQIPVSLIVLSKFTFMINCIINPLAYNLCSKDGRKGLRLLLHKARNRFEYKFNVSERSNFR